MKKFSFLLILAFMQISFSMKAQEKWSVELRPALDFPTRNIGNTDAKMGYGFDATGAYKLMPHLAVYAGWGWNQFKGDDDLSKESISFDETGYTFGFQIVRNIGPTCFSYYASAGAIYNRIKFENNANSLSLKSGYGMGWQLALGIEYEFASNLSLRPTLRYRSLVRNLEFDTISTDLKLNYISFGIGLVKDF